MNLGICPMASSSSGNCFLVRSNRTYILLDAGISSAAVKKNLEMMDVQFWEMNAVVLTHEHIDHVRSVSAYCHRSTRQHFFATEGTFAALEEKGKGIPKERVEIISPGSAFSIGDIEVTSFSLSHDAREPVGYSFHRNGKKISVVTDTGKVTGAIEEAIRDSDILIIEANHEENILLYGRYPYNIKHRILSEKGHLSNVAAGECIGRFLRNMTSPKIPYVMLAHLSQENNTPQQAMLTVSNVLEEEGFYVGRHLKLSVVQPKEMGDLVTI